MSDTRTDQLLVKVLGELKEINRRLAGMAGEPVPEKPKPWTGPSATAVTRNYLTHETVSGDSLLPTGKTKDMLDAEAAQKSRPSVHGQPVEPVGQADVRLTPEQLRNFR